MIINILLCLKNSSIENNKTSRYWKIKIILLISFINFIFTSVFWLGNEIGKEWMKKYSTNKRIDISLNWVHKVVDFCDITVNLNFSYLWLLQRTCKSKTKIEYPLRNNWLSWNRTREDGRYYYQKEHGVKKLRKPSTWYPFNGR